MAKTIRQLREERGWSQQELATRLKVATSTVYNWERGQYEPRFSQVKQLAKVFGVSMDDVVPSDRGLEQVGKAAA